VSWGNRKQVKCFEKKLKGGKTRTRAAPQQKTMGGKSNMVVEIRAGGLRSSQIWNPICSIESHPTQGAQGRRGKGLGVGVVSFRGSLARGQSAERPVPPTRAFPSKFVKDFQKGVEWFLDLKGFPKKETEVKGGRNLPPAKKKQGAHAFGKMGEEESKTGGNACGGSRKTERGAGGMELRMSDKKWI